MEPKKSNPSRFLAAGFLVALVAVLVGGGVAMYRNGYFSGKGNNQNQPSNSGANANVNTASPIVDGNIHLLDAMNMVYLSQQVNDKPFSTTVYQIKAGAVDKRQSFQNQTLVMYKVSADQKYIGMILDQDGNREVGIFDVLNWEWIEVDTAQTSGITGIAWNNQDRLYYMKKVADNNTRILFRDLDELDPGANTEVVYTDVPNGSKNSEWILLGGYNDTLFMQEFSVPEGGKPLNRVYSLAVDGGVSATPKLLANLDSVTPESGLTNRGFVSYYNGSQLIWYGNNALTVYAASTGKKSEYSLQPFFQSQFFVSPDGQQLVYESGEENQDSHQMVIYNLGNKTNRTYPIKTMLTDVIWNADQTNILYYNDNTLYALNVNTGKQTNILAKTANVAINLNDIAYFFSTTFEDEARASSHPPTQPTGRYDIGNGFSIKVPRDWLVEDRSHSDINTVKYGSPVESTSLKNKNRQFDYFAPTITLQTFAIDQRLTARDITNLIGAGNAANNVEKGKDKCASMTTEYKLESFDVYAYISDTARPQYCANEVSEPGFSVVIVLKKSNSRDALFVSFGVSNRFEYDKFKSGLLDIFSSVQFVST